MAAEKVPHASVMEDYPDYVCVIGMITIELGNLESSLADLLAEILGVDGEVAHSIYFTPKAVIPRVEVLTNVNTALHPNEELDEEEMREIRKRLMAEGSRTVRSVRENCHHRPSMRAARHSFSIAFRSFWLMTFSSEALVASYRMHVRPWRSLGSFEPLAWSMKVRRIPRAAPNKPASKTTLSRGDA